MTNGNTFARRNISVRAKYFVAFTQETVKPGTEKDMSRANGIIKPPRT